MDLKEINPDKILIVNIFGIGDVLFTTPLLRNLHRQFPSARLDYLCNSRVAPLLRDHELIDRVYVYDRDEFVAVQKKSQWQFIKKTHSFFNEIKQQQYPVMFDFSMNGMFGWMSRNAGIKHRIGLNYKNRSRWLTMSVPIKGYEGRHVAQYYLDLLEMCGLEIERDPLEVTIGPDLVRWARDFVINLGLKPDEPYIVIFPGGGSSWGKSADLKRWGVEKYAKLIDKIVENYPTQIILMGDKAEQNLCSDSFPQHHQVYKSFGSTTLGQLCAVLSQSAGVVCNDGGPLHMAVASGAKTISIFGPVDHRVYGPWLQDQHHQVVFSNHICRPCYRRFRMSDCQHVSCLREITVNDVYQKVAALL